MMTKNSMLIMGVLVGGSVFLLATNSVQEKITAFDSSGFHKLNTGGASTGNTGAPGENNCTSCHSGAVQNGNTINELSWTDDDPIYVPGKTYSFTLNFTNGSSKNGFQLVALESGNSNAGELVETDDLRTRKQTSFNGRQYLGHKAAGVGVSQWTFDWIAPEQPLGDVTFYVATNRTNANNGSSGDVIYLSQHVFNGPASTASISEYEQLKKSLQLAYNSIKQGFDISFHTEEKEQMTLSLHTLSGQLVFTENIGHSYPGNNMRFVQTPITQSGIYLVNFFVGNKGYSQKVVVE